MSTQDTQGKLLDRIRALLAKAESTDFPEEAEAFSAKAQQLMARHSIDHALLGARTGDLRKPLSRQVRVETPYETAKTLLLQVVSDANRCRSVWNRGKGTSTVVGHDADLDAVELMFTSLLLQATRAMMLFNPRPDRYGRNTTRSFRHAFLTSYAQRIGERLREATSVAESETPQDLLPALARHDAAVTETFAQMFPSIKTQAASISNRQGWSEGRAAADRAALKGYQEIGV